MRIDPKIHRALFIFAVSNSCMNPVVYGKCLLIYLGFYIAFNTVQVTSQRVVLWAEETSTVGQGALL